MTIMDLDQMPVEEKRVQLFRCCGSSAWVEKMLSVFPVEDMIDLFQYAEDKWNECSEADWREAFDHHPQIGNSTTSHEEDKASAAWAKDEQSKINEAADDVKQKLTEANRRYKEKFGYIFIIFATGKSAAEMLRILQDRSTNDHDEELVIAIGEQLKITIQRFKKLLAGADWSTVKPSQLTTHVLDTTLGRPAKEMTIRLKHFVDNGWFTLAQGVTNADGRVGDLLPSEKNVVPGNYKMVFETARYYKANNITGLYPAVEICFTVTDDAHYHIPLLLNPFGYSTYRGS